MKKSSSSLQSKRRQIGYSQDVKFASGFPMNLLDHGGVLRDVLRLLPILLLDAVAACQVPLMAAPPPGQTYYIAPEGGCIQGEYISRRSRHGYRTVLAELRKNGKAVANGSGTENRRELVALTRDDPPANALARSALRWQRFDSLMFLIPLAGTAMAVSGVWTFTLGSGQDQPAGAALMGLGVAGFLGSLPLTMTLPWYKYQRFEQAIHRYNDDAQAAGCADPPADLPPSTRTPGEGGRIPPKPAADPMLVSPTEPVDPLQSTQRVLDLANESQAAATRTNAAHK
jgi:hypothetical protein